MSEILETAKNAKKAFLSISCAEVEVKNSILQKVAEKIDKNRGKIFEANKKDLTIALEYLNSGEINKPTYDRLKLDENKMRDMIQGVLDVIKLEDPSKKIFWKRELDTNLILTKVACPIGVIGVIFEARPDVIAQISSLAIKSGNSVILKGGRESNNTNRAIFELIREALVEVSEEFKNVINIVYSRDDIKNMLELNEYIDLIIPRGSNKLVKFIQENTKIPVLGHSSGICHIYIDKSADYNMVKNIVIDAKTQYPSACNSVETVLIHKDFQNVEALKADIKSAGIEVVENPDIWNKEYGDKVLSLKLVENTKEAIEHINTFGSGHTDTIITQDDNEAKKFLKFVDSAGVFHNVSTRFSDGFRYGFGAEVGISTNKTHSRGPVGLDGLTIYKYLLQGSGQIVSDYAKGLKSFTHKNLSI